MLKKAAKAAPTEALKPPALMTKELLEEVEVRQGTCVVVVCVGAGRDVCVRVCA